MVDTEKGLTLAGFRNLLDQKRDLISLVGEVYRYPQSNSGQATFYMAERYFEVVDIFAGFVNPQYSAPDLNRRIDQLYGLLQVHRFAGVVGYSVERVSDLSLGNIELREYNIGIRNLEPISLVFPDSDTDDRVKSKNVGLGSNVEEHLERRTRLFLLPNVALAKLSFSYEEGRLNGMVRRSPTLENLKKRISREHLEAFLAGRNPFPRIRRISRG